MVDGVAGGFIQPLQRSAELREWEQCLGHGRSTSAGGLGQIRNPVCVRNGNSVKGRWTSNCELVIQQWRVGTVGPRRRSRRGARGIDRGDRRLESLDARTERIQDVYRVQT